ncbi:hypothetical protein PLESTM_000362700 [Pleodorina starrii]|nr:hypothetical protein PLESTM_000362700 [Pleodorina starrii]
MLTFSTRSSIPDRACHSLAGVLSGLTGTPHPAWRGCCRIDDSPAGPRHAAAAARRGRAAAGETAKDPPTASPAADSAADRPGPGGGAAAQPQQEPQQQQQPVSQARRQFGPEPPPPAAAADEAGQAPRRRGRPPKQKADPAAVGHQQPPAESTVGTASVPLAEATAAVAAAVAAGAASRDSGVRGARRPFGPEPPPPPPPSDLPFSLPEDPSQLNADDILDLPLPDPRVGEPFRLDGDFGDLGDLAQRLGEQLGDDADFGAAAAAAAAAVGGGGVADGADEDADLDYDKLIALASRVDAAGYVARAFERAKQGLEPVPDPTLEDEAEAAAEAPPPPPPRQDAAPPSRPPGAPPEAAAAAASAQAAAAGYAPPPRPSGDAVYVDDVDDVEDEDEGEGEEEDTEAAEMEAEAAAARRVALLVDLLSASGAELEAKLETAAPEVDEQLLALLERRYTTALALRQDAASAERIATLYRALRYMYERRNSSAAERLLDDVLGILADEALQPDPDRRRGEAAARLRNAFTGGMLDVDVFTAAAALAEGRQAAAEALAGETVSLESFKAEAMGLLGHAKRVQQQTIASLETIEAEVARVRGEEGQAALEGREWQVRLEQVRLARTALEEREQSIGALEEVLALTRAVEIQMMTGRMSGGGDE